MKRFKNVLFVADPEGDNANAFERAVQIAENNHAYLTVVSTIENVSAKFASNIQNISLTDIEKSLTEGFLSQLENLVAPTKKTIKIDLKILKGKPFLQLIQEVLRSKTDLVIKSVEDGEIANRFFGSTDLELLRKCPCPVLLLKPTTNKSINNILAAVDFKPLENNEIDDSLNQQILQMSTSLALSEASVLHIVHAWEAYGESSLRSGFAKQSGDVVDSYVNKIRGEHQKGLEKLLAEFGGASGKEAVAYLKPILHLVKGAAKTVIPDVAKKNQIDLMIMGTVGRIGIPGFVMGNTSEAILHQIDCSVFAMKPKGFVTPVTL
jgi:universal stress protein E